jgi:hypothetical protein
VRQLEQGGPPLVDPLEDSGAAEEREGEVVVHQLLALLCREVTATLRVVVEELLCVDLDGLLEGGDTSVAQIDTSESLHELIGRREGVPVRETERSRSYQIGLCEAGGDFDFV